MRCKTAVRAARSDLPASGAGSTHILGMFAAFLAKLMANQPEAQPEPPQEAAAPQQPRTPPAPLCPESEGELSCTGTQPQPQARSSLETAPHLPLLGEEFPHGVQRLRPKRVHPRAGEPRGLQERVLGAALSPPARRLPAPSAADGTRSARRFASQPPSRSRSSQGRRRGGDGGVFFFSFPWEFGGFFPFKPGVNPRLRCSRHPGRSAPHGPRLPPAGGPRAPGWPLETPRREGQIPESLRKRGERKKRDEAIKTRAFEGFCSLAWIFSCLIAHPRLATGRPLPPPPSNEGRGLGEAFPKGKGRGEKAGDEMNARG